MKNKKLILEWENTEIKDGTTTYEKFKVIVGSDKENLLFYSTFFTDNIKFKKGEIYQIFTLGKFVEDSSGIIQNIDGGEYEFEKIAPSLFIKEL